MSTRPLSKVGRAFSLIEIIAVIAILAVLALLSVPAVESMLKGSRVGMAANLVVDQLNLARQVALSKSIPVEVRFYKLPEEVSTAAPTFRAMQLFTVKEGVLIPLDKVTFLPPGVVISEVNTVSSLFLSGLGAPLSDPNERPAGSDDPKIPKYENNYAYISFRIKGNGQTDMKDKPAFLTLVSNLDKKDETTNLQKNFATIQIDPQNARTRVFRP